MSEWDVAVTDTDVSAAAQMMSTAVDRLAADTERDGPPTMTDVLVTAGEMVVEAASVAEFVAQMRHPKVKSWRVKLLAVNKAMHDGKPIGKAVLMYESPPTWTDDSGEINTGWLSNPMTRIAAGIARCNVGEYVRVWQLNEAAPEGYTTSSGQSVASFRRAIWVAGPNPYSPPTTTEATS